MIKSNPLPSALHVADYMLITAKLDYNMVLSPIKLNKLSYITDGFVLQLRDDPAFHNPVEAWKYGPIIRVIYEAFNYLDLSAPINELAICRTPISNLEKIAHRRLEILNIVGELVAGIISGVIQEYGTCNDEELIAMCYDKSAPWGKAYKTGKDNVIPVKTILTYYRQLTKYDNFR